MRYPPTHKLTTRRRIVSAASAAFRERGVEGMGLDEIMRRAGLTHGGFYAHFRDKTELVAEACAEAFSTAVINLDRIAKQPTSAKRARLLIDSYLSPRHRDNRSSGCLIVAVGADMARLTGEAREGFSEGFALHLTRLENALALNADPLVNHDEVTHLMSSLVGALLFARATTDLVRSDALLALSRGRLHREFCR